MPPPQTPAAMLRLMPAIADAVVRRRTTATYSLIVRVVLGLIFAANANAQSTWNATTGNWSSASNWLPASVPSSSVTTGLIFGGNASYTTTNDIGNFTLNQLQFNSTSGTVTLNGSPTTNALDFVASSSVVLPSITLTNAGSATIAAPVIWDANTSVSNSGSGALLFSGNQTFTNGTKQSFTNSGAGTITLADAITYANSGANTGIVLNLINNNSSAGTFNVGNLGGLSNFTLNIGGTGIVRFSGSTGGDLFSNSAVLNVLSGATFDFNANGETMGAVSGAGTIRVTGAGVNAQGSGYYVLSGKLTGTGTSATLTVNSVSHTLVLSGSANDYAGVTTLAAGRLVLSVNAPSGSSGALGNATSDVLVGNTSGSGFAMLLIDTPGVSVGRSIRLQSGNTGLATVGGLNVSGTVTYSGNIILGTNSAAAKGLAVYAAKGGTVEFTGGIQRATSATGTTDTLTVNGSGTVALRGTNTFTGATAVNGGTLLLDDVTNNTSKLSSTAALTLSGGSISLTGNGSATSTQTVNGLNLGNVAAPLGGGGRLTVTSGSGQSATLALGAIARNTGATADFVPVSVGGGTAAITTSTSNTSAGILGGYATFIQNDWARNDGAGNVVPLAAGSYTTSFGTGLHTSLSVASTALPGGGATTSTLRFTSTAAITFNSGTPGALTLESGGILVAATAGTTSIGTPGTRGTIATTGGELIVHQQSTSGTLTINSAIGGTTLTKSGDGTLSLSATNTYTGSTVVNGGTLSVTATANLGATTAGVVLNGGTLAIPSGTVATFTSTSHPITIGSNGGTFNFGINIGTQGGSITGTGTLTKMGSGSWNVGSNSSSFTGDIVINAGALQMNSNQFTNVASITVNSGGTYEVNDDSVGTFNITSGGRIVLNGNGAGSNGAIRITDQSPNVTGTGTGTDPRTTISNEVALQTTSRIQVENGSLTGSLSQLTLTGNVTGTGGLVKSGTGILVLTARDNSYSGGTTIENATLRTDLGNDRLPTSTTITLGAGTNSGMLQLNGFSQTIAGLTTAGTGAANAVIGGSATSTSVLTLSVASGTQTYSGSMGGTGANNTNASNNLGFIKDGAGTVVLGSANTYHGATSIAQGTLMLGNANALGNGGASLATGNAGTTVQAGTTLDLNGQSSVHEILTLNGSGVGNAGALVNNSATPSSIGNGIASLSISSVTTTGWSAGSTVTIDPPGSGTTATASAQLGLSAGSLSVTNGGSGFTLTNGTVNVSGGTGALAIVSLGVTSASYSITSGTTTYSVAPTATLPNGATATANLNGSGLVTSITITNPGSGFNGTPTLTFSGGTVLASGTNPTATGNTSNFTVSGLNVVNPGTGFTSVPVITITGGTGATAAGVDGNFILNGFSMTSNGSGYTSTPGVSISGGSAAATANTNAITLASNTSIGGSGSLTINPAISGNYSLTKVGAGTTTLTTANLYTGTTTISAGTLLVTNTSGSATGGGSVTVQSGTTLGGTGIIGLASGTLVSPNTSTSITADSGSVLMVGTTHNTNTGTASVLTLQTGGDGSTTSGAIALNGTVALDIFSRTAGLNATSNNDLLVFSSVNAVAISGSLQVKDTTGTSLTWAAGDAWQLFDWTNIFPATNNSGTFSSLDLPALNTGLDWNTSALYTSGTLSVIATVPEPSRALLLACGTVFALCHRRTPRRQAGRFDRHLLRITSSSVSATAAVARFPIPMQPRSSASE